MGKLIVGNLKMNLLTVAERDRYLESFKKEIQGKNLTDCEIVLCPPAIHLESFAGKIEKNNFSVGAQNIFWEDRGSFTGEISAPMVKNIGVEYVIVGHSERRKNFNETNEIVKAKINSTLNANLTPICCVGETLQDRQTGKTTDIIISQIHEGLADVPVSRIASVVIAYEPVWAVGSDIVPTSDEIMEVRILIKKIFADTFGQAVAEKIKILYGGSVKAATTKQLCIDPGMDGVLVGRESLIPMELIKIAEIINQNI
ncbi:MAG TPA: triose-phosphate isomerase [Candidatus Moranbacteria bacterium]|nr:triose-phosphate isomerase [Candidatus Moranbacteria bacterium]HBT46125.1 triose-phosphate isomerase [Candidatus Moranbacteria bacterium]